MTIRQQYWHSIGYGISKLLKSKLNSVDDRKKKYTENETKRKTNILYVYTERHRTNTNIRVSIIIIDRIILNSRNSHRFDSHTDRKQARYVRFNEEKNLDRSVAP